jgi:hypothetical protein
MVRRLMENPGSMVMSQKRWPQVSIKKMAGIVPKRKAPPPTSDMYLLFAASKPIWFMSTDM